MSRLCFDSQPALGTSIQSSPNPTKAHTNIARADVVVLSSAS